MEKSEAKRRIVLASLPAYGHLTPIMQLGKALNSKGFSITVALAQFSQVSSSQQQQFPGFQFVHIPGSSPVTEFVGLGAIEFMLKLNKTSEAGFKDCISQLNDIACIIYDDFFYICGAVANDLKLPSVTFSPQSAKNQVFNRVLSKLNTDKFLVDMEDPEMQEKVVENMDPLRYKDTLPTLSVLGPIAITLEFCREVANKRRALAAITNTVSCLESSTLSWLQQEVGIPVYPLGPLHLTASSAPASGLLEEDNSCIEWLNKQRPRSVMYISLGTAATVETKEILEMAWGLCNSNQPFLWVIRPESSLPEEVSEIVSERGYVVKWAPQIKVLAHPAVGGFWSHCGWNSTLESIAEGVPVICRPFHIEQKLNALYLASVYRVGIQLEGEVERGVIERAVKKLIVDEDGAGMRERAVSLGEKVKASVKSQGSSYNALNDLAQLLETACTNTDH